MIQSNTPSITLPLVTVNVAEACVIAAAMLKVVDRFKTSAPVPVSAAANVVAPVRLLLALEIRVVISVLQYRHRRAVEPVRHIAGITPRNFDTRVRQSIEPGTFDHSHAYGYDDRKIRGDRHRPTAGCLHRDQLCPRGKRRRDVQIRAGY